jgi:hypothetical protein
MTETIAMGQAARPTSGLAALAGREVRRYLRNPVFLAGVVFTALAVKSWHPGRVQEIGTISAYPAIFLGGSGLIAAFWLTQSTRRSAEALDVTPTTPQARTAAICAVAIVPFALGWLSFGIFVRIQPLDGVWRYGAFSSSDRMAVLVSQIVVPTLGGPLLGIALARWVRFPGTAIVAFLFLYGWVSLISILAWAHSNSLPFVMLRFFAPFTFFTLTDGPHNVDTWRGSPWFFVGWQLGLCAVAVTVALLRGADGRRQRRLVQVLIAAAAVTVLMYALTVTGGWNHPVMSHLGQAPVPIGHSPHPTNR